MRALGTLIVILALFGQAFAYKAGFPVLMLTLICSYGIGVIAYEDGKKSS